jgi:transaldolase
MLVSNLGEVAMKIFLDTANLEEIQQAADSGLLGQRLLRGRRCLRSSEHRDRSELWLAVGLKVDLNLPWESFDIRHELTTKGIQQFVSDYKNTLRQSA